MNITDLQRKLLAAAKARAPGDHVPYQFEKRIMMNLSARPHVDLVAWWGRALWRGAVASVGVFVLLALWSAISFDQTQAADTFSEDLEQTIRASVNEQGW